MPSKAKTHAYCLVMPGSSGCRISTAGTVCVSARDSGKEGGCMRMCECVYVCCWYATTKPVNMPLTMPPSMIEWLSVCTPVTLYKRCLSRCLYCMLCHEFSPSPTPTSPDLQSLTPNNGLYPRPKPIFQVGEVITIIFWNRSTGYTVPSRKQNWPTGSAWCD